MASRLSTSNATSKQSQSVHTLEVNFGQKLTLHSITMPFLMLMYLPQELRVLLAEPRSLF